MKVLAFLFILLSTSFVSATCFFNQAIGTLSCLDNGTLSAPVVPPSLNQTSVGNIHLPHPTFISTEVGVNTTAPSGAYNQTKQEPVIPEIRFPTVYYKVNGTWLSPSVFREFRDGVSCPNGTKLQESFKAVEGSSDRRYDYKCVGPKVAVQNVRTLAQCQDARAKDWTIYLATMANEGLWINPGPDTNQAEKNRILDRLIESFGSNQARCLRGE